MTPGSVHRWEEGWLPGDPQFPLGISVSYTRPLSLAEGQSHFLLSSQGMGGGLPGPREDVRGFSEKWGSLEPELSMVPECSASGIGLQDVGVLCPTPLPSSPPQSCWPWFIREACEAPIRPELVSRAGSTQRPGRAEAGAGAPGVPGILALAVVLDHVCVQLCSSKERQAQTESGGLAETPRGWWGCLAEGREPPGALGPCVQG